MIIKKENKAGIMTYYVDKDMTDEDAHKLKNKHLTRKQISTILNKDADVYTIDGQLLLRFRKNKLSPTHMTEFYENVIDFATLPTSNRGSASGSEHMDVKDNVKIMTNIIGFFDKFSPKQKMKMRLNKIKIIGARPCRFNLQYPEKYKKLIPLIQEIDQYYKKYVPESYAKQHKKAKQTHFKIANTSFTTITTNVNFQTTVHTDKGDDAEGFGNLSVISHGKYTGGETCLPQYGIGVNVMQGDILFMDVHQWHGNLPIILKTPDAKRLSIVCYLRHNIWENTHGKSKTFFTKQMKMVESMNAELNKNKTKKNKNKNKTNKNKNKTNRNKNKTKKNENKTNKNKNKTKKRK